MSDAVQAEGAPAWAQRAGAAALLSLPGLGYWVPFLGPWLSMLVVALAVPAARSRLWPRHGRRPRALRTLGIAGLWLPGLLAISFVLLFGELLGSPETSPWLSVLATVLEAVGTTYWLFLPLAGPEDHQTPAAVALTLVVAGTLASAYVQRPWPWLAGAAAAPMAYALTVHALRIPFIA
ncbi:MAG: hypothetical protein M3P93_05325 [Actinomycetota bacterium]|nr:hypothetical protein [Actinomycetota bacterium]